MPDTPIHPEARIGHVHLKVADLDRALAFWHGVLGLEVMQRMGDQAAFLSAGGYHHHIALNTWESAGGPPPPRGTTGLYHVALVYPDRQALAAALLRVVQAGDRARRRLRPRRLRGDLPARPGRQRGRALPRPPAGRMAARRRGRRWPWATAASTCRRCWPSCGNAELRPGIGRSRL